MKNRKIKVFKSQYSLIAISIFLIISASLISGQNITTIESKSRNLTFLLREYNEPYVFSNKTGIVCDIIREAMAMHNITVSFEFGSFERGAIMLSEKKIDAISIANNNAPGLEKAFFSQPYIIFNDMAFFLHEHEKVSLADIEKFDVIAFTNAKMFLGKEFSDIVEKNPRYREMKDQETQVRTLLLDRTDLIIMEKNIFSYYKNKLISEGVVDSKVRINSSVLFQPMMYCAVFAEKEYRDNFDSGLQKLKDSGVYNQIISSYTKTIIKAQ